MRERTTSSSRPPALPMLHSAMARMVSTCRATSPVPRTCPARSMAVVPACSTVSPTRSAREYWATCSSVRPELTLMRRAGIRSVRDGRGVPHRASLHVDAQADDRGTEEEHARDDEHHTVPARRLEDRAREPRADRGSRLMNQESDAEHPADGTTS